MAEKAASQDRWERTPGFCYFIAAGDPNTPVAIKIGVSTQRDIRRRFSTIQGGNHEPLHLLGVIPFDDGDRPMVAAQQKESALHRQFANYQRFRHGWAGSEWFTPSPEIMTYIAANTIAPETRGLERSIAKPGPGRATRSSRALEPPSVAPALVDGR